MDLVDLLFLSQLTFCRNTCIDFQLAMFLFKLKITCFGCLYYMWCLYSIPYQTMDHHDSLIIVSRMPHFGYVCTNLQRDKLNNLFVKVYQQGHDCSFMHTYCNQTEGNTSYWSKQCHCAYFLICNHLSFTNYYMSPGDISSRFFLILLSILRKS